MVLNPRRTPHAEVPFFASKVFRRLFSYHEFCGLLERRLWGCHEGEGSWILTVVHGSDMVLPIVNFLA